MIMDSIGRATNWTVAAHEDFDLIGLPSIIVSWVGFDEMTKTPYQNDAHYNDFLLLLYGKLEMHAAR